MDASVGIQVRGQEIASDGAQNLAMGHGMNSFMNTNNNYMNNNYMNTTDQFTLFMFNVELFILQSFLKSTK